ncbi:MAG: polysaccharide biosynthesis tyrosine autokinase [Pseudomonadota bacterium]
MRSTPITAQRAVGEDRNEVEVHRLTNALSRNKVQILIWMLVLFVAAGYYAFRIATPMYTATSTVALSGRNTQIVDLASPLAGLEGTMFTVNTEVEALTSRDLVEKLVLQENLMDSPVFNPTLSPADPSLIGQLFGAIRSLFAPAPEGPVRAVTEEELLESIIQAVQGAIAIENPRFSYVFHISITTADPEMSKRIANGLLRVYIEDQIAVKYEATEQATTWLNGRVAELKVDLETAENAVKAFTADSKLIGPQALAALNRQLKERRDRVAATKNRVVEQQEKTKALEAAQASGDIAAMAAAADDPALRRLVSRLDQTGARATFDTRFGQILERTRLEAERVQVQIAPLEVSVRDLEAQVGSQSAELLKLEQFEREAGATRQLYEYFLGRLKEVSAQQGVHQADSRILSKAILPYGPSSPNKFAIMMAAILFGGAVGSLVVIIRELRQTGFRSSTEIEQATGITVFAQIPKAPVTKRKKVLQYLTSRPASAFVEAVRNLRTSVLMSSIDKAPQLIMITSSLPGEGKTTQSLSLAQSFGGMEKSVLLIEGDIRRRTFQEYFSLSKGQPGLIQAVSGDIALDEAILHVKDLGFDVLPGERSAVNAADFFSSAKFRAFLTKLRDIYDVVIIDTPPVLVVPDARVIGPMADAIVYVVHWDKTTRVQVLEGVHALNTVDVKVAGLSLSQIDMKKARAYGGKYSEMYSSYGKRYYNN